MAVAAIMHIGLHKGAWVIEPMLIQAAIAFASANHYHKPVVSVDELASAMKAIPLDEAKVLQRFDRAFPSTFPARE